MNEYYSYCPECGESLTYSYFRCIRENPKTVDVTENWGKLMADLDRTRKELDLNKKLLARQCDLAREAETELELMTKQKEFLLKQCHEINIANNAKAKELETLRGKGEG